MRVTVNVAAPAEGTAKSAIRVARSARVAWFYSPKADSVKASRRYCTCLVSAIEVEGLRKSYGGREVLHDLSFNVET
ncbi:MAG: hypothetical protein WD027_09205, partial [Gaiellales bacterium]